MRIHILIFSIFFLSCKNTYYIIRHAEKEATNSTTTDVPLSDAGKQRAVALKDLLINKNIRYIFSTNTIRTTSTAKPLSDASGIEIELYNPRDTVFTKQLKNIKKGNVLVVGHSNTVDDIVNGLTGSATLQDLNDSRYGDLFIVKRKQNRFVLEHQAAFFGTTPVHIKMPEQ
jgi:broad specificity phosphatase PhoE